MPKKPKKVLQNSKGKIKEETPKEIDIKLDKDKIKYAVYAILGLILINLISTKKTYINSNLEVVTCRGLKFGEMCIGSKEITEENSKQLPNLIFHDNN